MAVEAGAAGIEFQARVKHQLCVPAIHIEGASYRLRQHADLFPEALRVSGIASPGGDLPRRRGRPPKHRTVNP